MMISYPRSRLVVSLLAGSLAVSSLTASLGIGADYGRLSGTVKDTQENPLMGATVFIIGPVQTVTHGAGDTLERIITDAQGKFTAEHLVPGWYSLRVTSATHLPAFRSGVRVEVGQTSLQNFVLSDIFAPLRFKVPRPSFSSWGEDWKWVLRTSAATRPVLRYQEPSQPTPQAKTFKPALPSSQRLIAMIPGSTRREALEGDPGWGSVLAYLRPLSDDADILVAGSMTANGLQASSLATAFRRNMLRGNPQELTLVVHQLSFSDGFPLAPDDSHQSLNQAQAVVLSYAHTRRLSESVTLTTGLEIHYFNAVRDATSVRPRVKLKYRVDPSNFLAVVFGSIRAEGDGTLLERVGVLNDFPRVTLRGYRPRLEELNHAEVSLDHSFGKTSRAEIAAYHDYFQNTAVWGFGGPEPWGALTGNFLPNLATNGVTFNAGNYKSSGLRVAYSSNVGGRVQTAFLYAFGDALTVKPAGVDPTPLAGNLRGVLRTDRSQTFAGVVSARIPICKAQVTTSYQWAQRGRVTGVDPYGQASFQLQPFLGIQIRQPLPTLAFLPAHIEALADFRNLLAQGYVPLLRSGEDPLVVTTGYRSFRGGFSVQF